MSKIQFGIITALLAYIAGLDVVAMVAICGALISTFIEIAERVEKENV